MRPPAGSARRWAATCSFSRRSSASASNSSLRVRRYSLDSPGKWTFGSRSTSRHLFMSRGLPLRAIVSILSYAPNSLPCRVGNSERLLKYCAFCGVTHSAVEHREEGVKAFRQSPVSVSCFASFRWRARPRPLPQDRRALGLGLEELAFGRTNEGQQPGAERCYAFTRHVTRPSEARRERAGYCRD